MIIEQDIILEKTLNWLRTELGSRGLSATIVHSQIARRQREYHFFLGIPVSITEPMIDAYQQAQILPELECAWNFQEPRPDVMLTLLPPGLPEGVW